MNDVSIVYVIFVIARALSTIRILIPRMVDPSSAYTDLHIYYSRYLVGGLGGDAVRRVCFKSHKFWESLEPRYCATPLL